MPTSFEPKALLLGEGHPLCHPGDDLRAQPVCCACRDPFLPDQFVCLIPLGPGTDQEERALARQGRAYTAMAAPVHWPCATGYDSP